MQSSRHRSFVHAPTGTIRVVENNLEFYAYGNDFEGGQTEELLRNIYNRFGPVASFTGTYQVDSWSLTIDRGSPDTSKLKNALKVRPDRLPLNPNFLVSTNLQLCIQATSCMVSSLAKSIYCNCMLHLILEGVHCTFRLG